MNKVLFWFLVFLCALVVAGLTFIIYWYLIRDDEGDEGGDDDTTQGTVAPSFNGTLNTDDMFKFLEYQIVDEGKNLDSLNACSTMNNATTCLDDKCSNCICPDECSRRGTKYMVMDHALGADKYRCLCTNRLRDVIDDGSAVARSSALATVPASDGAAVWEKINTWKYRLLPPDMGDDRITAGSGGEFTVASPYYPFDAQRKVYLGQDGAVVSAVYMLNSQYDDFAMANRLSEE